MADLRFYVTQEGTLVRGVRNDTVFNYTGTFSSDTVKGLDGKDLISFANQTTAITFRATVSAGKASQSFSAGAGSAGTVFAVYSGTYVSAGVITKGLKTASTAMHHSSGPAEASATMQQIQQTGISTMRGGLVGGNTGNDSIYLGDQLTEFASVFVGGGQDNDLIGTFNSAANTAGKLNTTFSGSTLAGGEGNDTVS